MNRKKDKDGGKYFPIDGTKNEFTLMELDLKTKTLSEIEINT